ncbi:MAG: response regulator [Betaproteobacteria bacterium]|nr:response regulator [Betaproteobacteria bacterium]
MTRILLVEDEVSIRRFVAHALASEGLQVDEVDTLARAHIEAGTRKPDLAIVDLGLPDGDGAEFIRGLRAWSTMPVLVLSARGSEVQKVAALDAGADDYLVKPFGVAEMLARVRALLRRRVQSGSAEPRLLLSDRVTIDLSQQAVLRDGERVKLTPNEWRLLAVLAANAGRVMTYRALVGEVWGPAHAGQSHYARVCMQHLRAKLERDPAKPEFLLTEVGVGYRLASKESGA